MEMDEKNRFDEFGNKVEYVASEAADDMEQAGADMKEGFNDFKDEAKKKADRLHMEGKIKDTGTVVSRGARSILEFAGDAIGLMILKGGGNKDTAYKVIKGGRSAAETAEDLLGKAFHGGSKVVGQATEKMDVEAIRHRAGEMKERISHKVNQSEMMDKVHPGEIKAKVEETLHKVTEKVNMDDIKTKVGETFSKVTEKVKEVRKDTGDDPVSAEQKKMDLEAKIDAFEKLYEEDTKDQNANQGYKPEERKEDRP